MEKGPAKMPPWKIVAPCGGPAALCRVSQSWPAAAHQVWVPPAPTQLGKAGAVWNHSPGAAQPSGTSREEEIKLCVCALCWNGHGHGHV